MRDGLAGSIVYQLCQDKDGFIWFATEAGLSRFDGTHFRTFNTSDGLPEAEILQVFADSKGRVWIAPFRNTICYYYKGKLHTQENDSMLKKIPISSIVMDFREARDSTVCFMHGSSATLIIPDPKNRTDSIFTIHWKDHIMGFGPGLTNNTYLLLTTDSVFTYDLNKKRIIYGRKSPIKKKDSLLMGGDERISYYIKNRYRIAGTQGNPNFISTYSGAFFYDSIHRSTLLDSFLLGKTVHRAMIDREQNFWFATNNGVYKLMSREVRSWLSQPGSSFEIFSLLEHKGLLLAGSDKGRLCLINRENRHVDSISFDQYLTVDQHITNANRLTAICSTPDNKLLLGFDTHLARFDPVTRKSQISLLAVLKSITLVNQDTILVGTGHIVLLMNSQNLQPLDTIWPGRTTVASFANNTYYIGTVNGLYAVDRKKRSQFLGASIRPLTFRIAAIQPAPDGSVWVATYGNGIVQLRDNKIVRHLTEEKGLTSNICRSLFLHNRYLWAGTDKGICKIDLDLPATPIVSYTVNDGLPSNIINTLYVDDNIVYVGTVSGLTLFNESRLKSFSRCDLRLLNMDASGISIIPDSNRIQLDYLKNNLRFSFVGISYKSGGDILYRYRLKGLNNSWDSTHQTTLEYPGLPPGDYQLELSAINKFGIKSEPLLISFSIDAPFWQTIWFKLSSVASIIVLAWWLIRRRYAILQRREQEKATLQSRMNELEQQALRSQMNPHFIFNCLNSIQNFIIRNDFETTNQYLTEFAYLLRQTLDNSSRSTISLHNEITYLDRYLKMERMRFANAFTYTIEVDPLLDQETIMIPAMLLQPYVENSVRHGVRHMTDNNGHISIQFISEQDTLVCVITDNGIGRKRAAETRSRLHVEYQSKGMSLTAERIRVLNRVLVHPITLEIVDLADDSGAAAGTRITLRFPPFIQSQPNAYDTSNNN